MALQLSGYNFDGVPVPAAYLEIEVVTMDIVNLYASLTFAIYASSAAKAAGSAPLFRQYVPIKDGIPAGTTLFTTWCLSVAPGDGAAAQTPLAQIVLALAYETFQAHPAFTALLAGAVTVA